MFYLFAISLTSVKTEDIGSKLCFFIQSVGVFCLGEVHEENLALHGYAIGKRRTSWSQSPWATLCALLGCVICSYKALKTNKESQIGFFLL